MSKRQKQRNLFVLGQRERFSPVLLRATARKKERKKGKTRALFFLSMAFSWERARVCFATVSAAFGKNKRDIPAGMSAGRTHNIDTKFGVNKKGAEACEKRERERERERKRGRRKRLTSVPFLSMSSSHEREERRRSNLSSRGTYLIA